MGQGQHRVIIYINSIELEYIMLNAKFHDHRTNMKSRHCLLSDTESETYMAQYTISYDVIHKRKKLPNLTLLQTGQPSYNFNKL